SVDLDDVRLQVKPLGLPLRRIGEHRRNVRKRDMIRSPPRLRIERIAGQISCNHDRTAGSRSILAVEFVYGPVQSVIPLHHSGMAVPEMSFKQPDRIGPRVSSVPAAMQKE